jgi:signal recognition particle receptor subunit beta
MPYVDHARQELRFKVVYYGPGLGGKTTNLEYIHAHTRPDLRGKLIALNDVSERTLFFDLLPVELGTYRGYSIRVHLCTVPGQIAQNRVRQLVLRHVDGIVMVVDSQRGRIGENYEAVRNLETNLRLQGDDPAKMPMVVQYNKRDLPSAAPVALLADELGVPDDVLQIEAVSTEGKGVFDTFKGIVRASLALVDDPGTAPAGRSPSIIPGRHASMFPEAVPEAVSEDGRDTLPTDPPVPYDGD